MIKHLRGAPTWSESLDDLLPFDRGLRWVFQSPTGSAASVELVEADGAPTAAHRDPEGHEGNLVQLLQPIAR